MQRAIDDPSFHPNHLSTQTMRLRSGFNFDEAYAKVLSVSRRHNYEEYLGQMNNDRASHGGAVGFGLLGFILQDLLAIQDGDYFVDIGSGCGMIPNTIGLYQPLATSVGVERSEYRSFIAAATAMILTNHEPCIRSFTTPQFYRQNFTDENFMAEHLNKEHLKMFFNNFDGFFLYEGIQLTFERLANTYCRPGTQIVSLGLMFFSDVEWSVRIVDFMTSDLDLSWSRNPRQLDIYVYTKLTW
jgi:hypothetical protein